TGAQYRTSGDSRDPDRADRRPARVPGVRDPALWGSGPGLRACPVWVTDLLPLGYRAAQFGPRACSVWAAGLLSLGRGPAQFGPRIPCENFSQVFVTKLFMRLRPFARLIRLMLTKNNTNKTDGGAFSKVFLWN